MPLLATDLEFTRNAYYAATAGPVPTYPRLTADTVCDVAVVGGGLAGLSAAIELRQRGFDVVLLEAQQVGFGASGRNGGQAIHGLACEQDVIESQLGLDEAKRVWALTLEALDLLRKRIRDHAIDCDWQSGYLGLATSVRKGRALAAWAERMESVYGYSLQRIAAADIGNWIASPRFHSGIHDQNSGHLNPLKYTRGLARAAAAAGVRIFEHSPALALLQGERPVLRTCSGQVTAERVLLAGNVYLHDLVPTLAQRIMPVGTYMACSEALSPALCASLIPSRAAVCDTNFVLDYFRTTPDHRLLYGGRVSYSSVTPARLADSMRQRLVHTFPQLAQVKVECAWGGFVDITMNRAPDFGRLPAVTRGRAQNVYYLQGFSGHGLALTGLAGRLVAEAMAGDASRFDVFTRLQHRAFPGGDWLRTPALVLGMAWCRLRDRLGDMLG